MCRRHKSTFAADVSASTHGRTLTNRSSLAQVGRAIPAARHERVATRLSDHLCRAAIAPRRGSRWQAVSTVRFPADGVKRTQRGVVWIDFTTLPRPLPAIGFLGQALVCEHHRIADTSKSAASARCGGGAPSFKRPSSMARAHLLEELGLQTRPIVRIDPQRKKHRRLLHALHARTCTTACDAAVHHRREANPFGTGRRTLLPCQHHQRLGATNVIDRQRARPG